MDNRVTIGRHELADLIMGLNFDTDGLDYKDVAVVQQQEINYELLDRDCLYLDEMGCPDAGSCPRAYWDWIASVLEERSVK